MFVNSYMYVCEKACRGNHFIELSSFAIAFLATVLPHMEYVSASFVRFSTFKLVTSGNEQCTRPHFELDGLISC